MMYEEHMQKLRELGVHVPCDGTNDPLTTILDLIDVCHRQQQEINELVGAVRMLTHGFNERPAPRSAISQLSKPPASSLLSRPIRGEKP